jgi:hypothetical protein
VVAAVAELDGLSAADLAAAARRRRSAASTASGC